MDLIGDRRQCPTLAARPPVTDLRRPWEKPAEPQIGTRPRPQGFRNLHTKTGSPAGAPKQSKPGPGGPPGSKNRPPATRDEVGCVLAFGETYSRPAYHKAGTRPHRAG